MTDSTASFNFKRKNVSNDSDKKAPWQGVAGGSYVAEILDFEMVQDWVNWEDHTKGKMWKIKVNFRILEGDRAIYPFRYWADKNADDYSAYSKKLDKKYPPLLKPQGEGEKGAASGFYKLVAEVLYNSNTIPEEDHFYYTDASLSDEEAGQRFNELLDKLKGQQVTIAVGHSVAPNGADRNNVKSVTNLRKNKWMPAYTPPTIRLTQEQIDDANPKIRYLDNDEVIYGYYAQSGEFVTQAKTVEWLDKGDGRYSYEYRQALKEQKAEKTKAATTPDELFEAAELPF